LIKPSDPWQLLHILQQLPALPLLGFNNVSDVAGHDELISLRSWSVDFTRYAPQ
jgi:hypothetical protein